MRSLLPPRAFPTALAAVDDVDLDTPAVSCSRLLPPGENAVPWRGVVGGVLAVKDCARRRGDATMFANTAENPAACSG
ncbi:hypothetical protein T484DRAFT_1807515 [Baffinella frigidus]|nr:hypothetical protein T484DRAFT_1807515 [Cryptophyta sp. CCMP2293]